MLLPVRYSLVHVQPTAPSYYECYRNNRRTQRGGGGGQGDLPTPNYLENHKWLTVSLEKNWYGPNSRSSWSPWLVRPSEINDEN